MDLDPDDRLPALEGLGERVWRGDRAHRVAVWIVVGRPIAPSFARAAPVGRIGGVIQRGSVHPGRADRLAGQGRGFREQERPADVPGRRQLLGRHSFAEPPEVGAQLRLLVDGDP